VSDPIAAAALTPEVPFPALLDAVGWRRTRVVVPYSKVVRRGLTLGELTVPVSVAEVADTDFALPVTAPGAVGEGRERHVRAHRRPGRVRGDEAGSDRWCWA